MQRHITLDFSENEFNELRDFLKEETGMSPKEVLKGFIKDLINADDRNGSDEHECAKAWLKRAYADRYHYWQNHE